MNSIARAYWHAPPNPKQPLLSVRENTLFSSCLNLRQFLYDMTGCIPTYVFPVLTRKSKYDQVNNYVYLPNICKEDLTQIIRCSTYLGFIGEARNSMSMDFSCV